MSAFEPDKAGWAQARMWAWEQLDGWSDGPSEDKKSLLGFLKRAEYAEILSRWVMFGPSSIVSDTEAASVAEEPKA